jgi:hypothetical protein
MKAQEIIDEIKLTELEQADANISKILNKTEILDLGDVE